MFALAIRHARLRIPNAISPATTTPNTPTAVMSSSDASIIASYRSM